MAQILAGASWLWVVLAIPFLSDAACNILLATLWLLCGCLIGFIWIGITIAALIRRGPMPWLLWLMVPVAGSSGLTLLWTDRDLAVRVALCEESLSHFVSKVPPETHDHETKWVGLFHINETMEYEGGVYLFTSQSFINSHGVAKIPDASKLAPRMRVKYRFGQWYSFDQKF